jgi:hypothetical protein
MTVTVDLHKKTDPADEFDARSRADIAVPGGDEGLVFSYMDDHETTTHPAGLGDRANLTTGIYRQALSVRHGGAVFSLTLFGFNQRDDASGDSSMLLPRVAETSAFRKDLAPTVRTLMQTLSHPPSS